jgi:hypothetical protein
MVHVLYGVATMYYLLLVFSAFISSAEFAHYFLQDSLFRNGSTQRIEKHIKHLMEINKILKNDEEFFKDFLIESPFHHELMSCCVSIMRKEETLDAFSDMWKFYLKHKAHIPKRTDVFLRESCILLLLTYNYCILKPQKGMISDMSSLYNQLSALPLPELLDLLDTTYTSLKKIFINYNAPNTVTWMAKYWWVPPVAVTALSYTVFKWYIARIKSKITE